MPGHSSRFYPRTTTALFLTTALLTCRGAAAAELHPETLRAWQRYIDLTEARIDAELQSNQGFLVSDFLPPADAAKAREALLSEQPFVLKMRTLNEEGRKIDVPKGMIHHWLGGILIRGVELDEVLEWIQSYSHFKEHFEQVEECRILSRDGDVFRIFMRITGKRFRRVYYNTEHEVVYRHYGPDKASSRSEATKIAQLEDPGTADEREKPEGRDSGYMWRWNSYWRFKQTGEGVIVECESISLSRDIPFVFKWFIQPFVTKVPKDALDSTLTSMRKALTTP